MVSRFFTSDARLRQNYIPSSGDIDVRFQWRSIFLGLIETVTLGLMLLVLGVMAVARMEPVTRILDLPQPYLPGSLPPESMSCAIAAVSVPRCWAEFRGYEVFFDFDSRTIIRTVIPTEKYALGQLIVSWGTPAGVNWNHYTVYVYWPTRWVILSNSSFRPTSPVKSILYTPEQPPSSPWRGFRRAAD